MQHQKILEQLGYTSKEAKVYLTSLKLGEAHVSDIAARVKMPRSTVQTIVDRLHGDGLMNFYVMRRYKYWVAERPEQLLKNLEKREAALKAAMPELAALRKTGRGGVRRDKQHKRSIAVFKMTADATEQPVLIANSDAEIEYVNRAWQLQFGYTLEEVRGENPRVFKSGKTPFAVYANMWQTLRAGKLFQSDEIIDECKDGTCINLLTTIFAVQHGNRKFYIQILDDITKQKQVENIRKNFQKPEKK